MQALATFWSLELLPSSSVEAVQYVYEQAELGRVESRYGPKTRPLGPHMNENCSDGSQRSRVILALSATVGPAITDLLGKQDFAITAVHPNYHGGWVGTAGKVVPYVQTQQSKLWIFFLISVHLF